MFTMSRPDKSHLGFGHDFKSFDDNEEDEFAKLMTKNLGLRVCLSRSSSHTLTCDPDWFTWSPPVEVAYLEIAGMFYGFLLCRNAKQNAPREIPERDPCRQRGNR